MKRECFVKLLAKDTRNNAHYVEEYLDCDTDFRSCNTLAEEFVRNLGIERIAHLIAVLEYSPVYAANGSCKLYEFAKYLFDGTVLRVVWHKTGDDHEDDFYVCHIDLLQQLKSIDENSFVMSPLNSRIELDKNAGGGANSDLMNILGGLSSATYPSNVTIFPGNGGNIL